MIIKIPLRVENLDADSPAYLEMDETLGDDLIWTVTSGVMTADLFVEDGDPIALGADAARLIRKLIPGASIAGVHDELVSISDIAFRAGVAAEGVRLWADGKRRASAENPFPRVEQAVTHGQMTVRLYAWRKVVAWLRAVPRIEADEDITYLDDERLAELNSLLHQDQTHQPRDTPVTFQPVPVTSVLEAVVAVALKPAAESQLVAAWVDELTEVRSEGPFVYRRHTRVLA